MTNIIVRIVALAIGIALGKLLFISLYCALPEVQATLALVIIVIGLVVIIGGIKV